VALTAAVAAAAIATAVATQPREKSLVERLRKNFLSTENSSQIVSSLFYSSDIGIAVYSRRISDRSRFAGEFRAWSLSFRDSHTSHKRAFTA